MPKMVLPEPGPPPSIVVRPRGKPPPVMASKPSIPEAAFPALEAWLTRAFIVVP
jgi:hypothetical protein